MRAATLLIGVVMMGAASPATACRGGELFDYVLLDQPPPVAPETILIQVRAPAPATAFPVSVRGVILNARGRGLKERSVTIRMNGGSSCSVWAESPTASLTVGRLRKENGKLIFEARRFLGADGRRVKAMEQQVRDGKN